MRIIRQKFKKAPYTSLFISIIALFILSPILKDHELFINCVILFVMFSTVFALDLKKSTMVVCLALGAISFFLAMISFYMGADEFPRILVLVKLLSYCLFFLIVILIFLRKIFLSKAADRDAICGGVSVYFLMGVLWAFLYHTILFFDSTAIAFSDLGRTTPDILYFSFTTLTTLGYGDTLPVSHLAKNLTILESSLGQIFLTVLVARLVGLHLMQAQKE